MNDLGNKRAAVYGFFVLLGLLFLIAGVFFVGSLHKIFEQKVKIVTVFDNVNGLQKGDYIWLSGVVVGTVNDLHFSGISKVTVEINIDKNAKHYIRKDAKIKLSTDGLIGNNILVIYGGSPQYAEIEVGDTLLMEKTFSTEEIIKTLQENNKNILAITTDFKVISKKMAEGDGTIGKLLNDNTVYDNINNAVVKLQNASKEAHSLMTSLSVFSSNLNTNGTLAHELTTDTIVFNSLKMSIIKLQKIAKNADELILELKQASTNPNTPIGILLHDQQAGSNVKEVLKNLESSSIKLNENLEALQHNILFKKYFKKQAKTAENNYN